MAQKIELATAANKHTGIIIIGEDTSASMAGGRRSKDGLAGASWQLGASPFSPSSCSVHAHSLVLPRAKNM